MYWRVILVATILWTTHAAAAETGRPLPPGTLLFLENCNSVVQWTTQGSIAHVAIVLPDAAQTWVYEATPGKVRRVTLDDYHTELARLNHSRDEGQAIRLHALRPATEYSPAELARMRSFLDSQLGRRYSVKNYVRGQPYDGIHCAELASTTLNKSGRYAFADCHSINPQALYTAVLAQHAPPETVTIAPLVATESWWVRAQRRCLGWLVWCRWSSREAWLFLW